MFGFTRTLSNIGGLIKRTFPWKTLHARVFACQLGKASLQRRPFGSWSTTRLSVCRENPSNRWEKDLIMFSFFLSLNFHSLEGLPQPLQLLNHSATSPLALQTLPASLLAPSPPLAEAQLAHRGSLWHVVFQKGSIYLCTETKIICRSALESGGHIRNWTLLNVSEMWRFWIAVAVGEELKQQQQKLAAGFQSWL